MTPASVRAELVEALYFAFHVQEKGQAFDKLRPNGDLLTEALA